METAEALFVVLEDGSGREVDRRPFVGSTFVIGRSRTCDLQVPLESVSKRHAELSRDGRIVRVRDCASTGGIYIDGTRPRGRGWQILAAEERLVLPPRYIRVEGSLARAELATLAADPSTPDALLFDLGVVQPAALLDDARFRGEVLEAAEWCPVPLPTAAALVDTGDTSIVAWALRSPDVAIVAHALGRRDVPPEQLDRLLADPREDVRRAIALSPSLRDRHMTWIVEHGPPAQRRALCFNERGTPRSVARRLREDPDPAVRAAAVTPVVRRY